MYIRSSKNRKARRVVAEEEIPAVETEVEVAPEATELVFETEDVAELIAEVTGQDVEVAADENEVTFTVGDMDYTVEAEGGEEVLEASTRVCRKTPVRANTAAKATRPSTDTRKVEPTKGRVVRRVNR